MTLGIIGGGIAGLATAIACAKIGREVDMYERAGEFAEVGAGLQIGPNAVSALKLLGAFDLLEPQAVAPDYVRIHDGLSGKLLSSLPLGEQFAHRFGQPYRVAHRADLLSALVETAKTEQNITFHLNSALLRLEIEPDHATCHFSTGQQARHEYLVGADGFRSVVRRSVLNDGPPIFAGHSLYRTLIPMDNAPDIAYVQDVNLWLYPKGHVVHYPVSAGKKLNIVAASEQNWQSKDWSTPVAGAEVAEYFSDAARQLQAVIEKPEGWLKWAAAGHPFSHTWHKHNTILIGDAIHPTLPYLAQGAAMALEDSVCLAHNLRHGTSFDEFVKTRQPRTRKIVETSQQLGKAYHLAGPTRLARNLVIRHTTPGTQLSRLSWLYDWKAPAL